MQKKTQKPTVHPPADHDKVTKAALSADDLITDFSCVNLVTVSANQDGQRLDNFLLARLKGLPRSHLYKLIRDDEIRINKKRCKPHNRLQVGDVVRIAPVRLAVRDMPIIGEAFAKGLLSRIVHEDDGLIVLDKPHGMAVHGGSGECFGVIEALRVASGKKYLELIHRIDKDTSGLLLIAKKRSTLKALQEAFRTKNVQKTYLCLVHGTLKAQIIDQPLLKYTLTSGERRVKIDPTGKPSQTYIKVLASFYINDKVISLVQASPKTGRTHQIRVHMASIGHALLGDDKYQTRKQADWASSVGIGRLCLHAWRLHLPVSADRSVSFTADIPDDMASLIALSDWQAAPLSVDSA